MPSDTSLLGLVRELTKRAAVEAGFEAGVAAQIALAVDEATTNVIEHAYRGASDRDVELRFDPRSDEFRVEIVDSGEMVDPRAVPRVDPDRDARERRTGGLGGGAGGGGAPAGGKSWGPGPRPAGPAERTSAPWSRRRSGRGPASAPRHFPRHRCRLLSSTRTSARSTSSGARGASLRSSS